jgi:copper homeostasis protein CutC
VTIPVHPIIRPRGGDFCYTAGEFAAMLDDVAAVKDLGFPGMVIGVLDADGQWIGRDEKNNGGGGNPGRHLSSGL